jgi:hypothetical protein
MPGRAIRDSAQGRVDALHMRQSEILAEIDVLAERVRVVTFPAWPNLKDWQGPFATAEGEVADSDTALTRAQDEANHIAFWKAIAEGKADVITGDGAHQEILSAIDSMTMSAPRPE